MTHVPEATFNLSSFADRLISENRKLSLANKIKSAVDARSIEVDLMLALEACDALAFSFDSPINQPPQFREASEAALMNYFVLLYARATKSESKVRKQYDPLPKFTLCEKKVHQELCDLRDDAVAHFGKGGSYVGNWVIEMAVMDVAPNQVRSAILTRRQIVDRPLLVRARAQIERALEIIRPIVATRINAFTSALNAEAVDDPEFYKEVHQHPLNTSILIGGADQAEQMKKGRMQGQARGAFGHS